MVTLNTILIYEIEFTEIITKILRDIHSLRLQKIADRKHLLFETNVSLIY